MKLGKICLFLCVTKFNITLAFHPNAFNFAKVKVKTELNNFAPEVF